MNLWIPFWIFGLAIIVTLHFLTRALERERLDSYNNRFCDHGPSEYDSYCPKCGLDS